MGFSLGHGGQSLILLNDDASDNIAEASGVTFVPMLTLAVGQASLASQHGSNQDYFGCVTPEGERLRDKGAAFAVADGVGRGKGGREAAETATRIFLSDYYSSPDTWSVQKCLEHVLEHANIATREPGRGGGAATFAGLILKGHRYFVVNAGDARIYLLRQGVLTRLTEDHVWNYPDLRNVVSRAIGLDVHLHPDYKQDELRAGDVFLICTDGFYKGAEPTAESLSSCISGDLQQSADDLLTQTSRAGGEDDVTFQLVRVEALPPNDELDAVDLPLAKDVREGVTLDDFYIAKRLHKGQLSEVYLADDLRHGRKVVLKFPVPGSGSANTEVVDRFLREEWVGRRVQNPHVLPALSLEAGRRSRLYYATPWQSGETLRRKLERGSTLPAADTVRIGIQICKGLEALHRMHVLHRDIKPDNVLVNEQGTAMLLDLGVAHAEAFSSEESVPGTPSYMAPEMFRGAVADERTEVYALGVTLYELMTRKFPYGEIEPFSQPRFQRWTPPSRYNPDIPLWLETILQKATEADPARRFQALSELQYHLERRERAQEENSTRPDPGVRKGTLVWKLLACGFALLALIEFLAQIKSRH